MANWLIRASMKLQGIPNNTPDVVEPVGDALSHLLHLARDRADFDSVIGSDMALGYIVGITMRAIESVLGKLSREENFKIIVIVLQKAFHGHEDMSRIRLIAEQRLNGLRLTGGNKEFRWGKNLGSIDFAGFPHRSPAPEAVYTFRDIMNGDIYVPEDESD